MYSDRASDGGKRRQPLHRRAIAAALALVLFPALLPAARGDWESLHSLKPGDRIRVTQSDQRRIQGVFQAATESGIVLRTGQEVTISKADVTQVEQYAVRRRLVRILIGAGVGAVAGVIVNSTLGTYFHNEGHDFSGAACIAGSIGVGAGAGALAGGSYRTIYRRYP